MFKATLFFVLVCSCTAASDNLDDLLSKEINEVAPHSYQDGSLGEPRALEQTFGAEWFIDCLISSIPGGQAKKVLQLLAAVWDVISGIHSMDANGEYSFGCQDNHFNACDALRVAQRAGKLASFDNDAINVLTACCSDCGKMICGSETEEDGALQSAECSACLWTEIGDLLLGGVLPGYAGCLKDSIMYPIEEMHRVVEEINESWIFDPQDLEDYWEDVSTKTIPGDTPWWTPWANDDRDVTIIIPNTQAAIDACEKACKSLCCRACKGNFSSGKVRQCVKEQCNQCCNYCVRNLAEVPPVPGTVTPAELQCRRNGGGDGAEAYRCPECSGAHGTGGHDHTNAEATCTEAAESGTDQSILVPEEEDWSWYNPFTWGAA